MCKDTTSPVWSNGIFAVLHVVSDEGIKRLEESVGYTQSVCVNGESAHSSNWYDTIQNSSSGWALQAGPALYL